MNHEKAQSGDRISLQIDKARAGLNYSLSVQVLRVFWAVGRAVFRLTPRPFYAPRRLLLRCFGARIGRHVHIANTATIYFPWNLEVGDWSAIGEGAYIYNLGNITIGEKTTISQRAHLCAGTHDYTDPTLPLQRPPIGVGDQVWVCADAFVGPGVTIGEGAVVGARAVITKDVEPWTVVAGNPATFIKNRIMKASLDASA